MTRPGDTTSASLLDETTVWELLRALPRGGDGWGGGQHVAHPERTDAWLRVQPSGRWESSHAPTGEARLLLELFLPLLRRTELVIAQMGQSLDGRIATESGHSHYVTGPRDIRRLHRLRALVDAVVVGAGTVASDDPRLTVREVEGENPVRVVLDPDGRLDPGRSVFTDGAAPTLVVRREGGTSREERRAPALWLAGDGPDGSLPPGAILEALRGRGLRWVLVEGGGVTVSRFLQAGTLHRLHVTVACLLLGSGRPAFTLDPIETLDEALRPRGRHFALGDDVLFDLELDAPPGAPDPGPA